MKLVNLIEAGLQVGDWVWCHSRQCFGQVKRVSVLKSTTYPISVEFNDEDAPEVVDYTKDGRQHFADKVPDIFLDKLDFEIPTTKPEPDYAKEFVTNTPWMVRDLPTSEWFFRRAAVYCKGAGHPFYTFTKTFKGKDAMLLTPWQYARKLTVDERAHYLGEQV